MFAIRISPALKRAVVQAAKADGAPDTSEWVRRLLMQHTHKERAQA